MTTIIVSEVTSLKHREEEKEHEGGGGVGGGCRAREREEEKGPTGLFIEPATNIEQLVSIRPVIAAFTQCLSYPLAKWRCGRANIHFFPGTMKVQTANCYRAIFFIFTKKRTRYTRKSTRLNC